MDNNNNKTTSPFLDIVGIVGHAENLLKVLKTGEGLGLNDEQKEQFKKQMAESQPANNAAEKLKDELANLKKAADAANEAHDKNMGSKK